MNICLGAEVGTVITTITANDVDTNPSLTYTFARGGNPSQMFTIDKFSGKITLASPLDHEATARYTIEVFYRYFLLLFINSSLHYRSPLP